MRAQRQLSPVDLYHIIARGTGRQNIFEDDADRKMLLKLCADALRDNEIELYAWCLMSNHVHLVVHAPMPRLSAFMKALCGQYARYFNKKAGRSGHLFQERFRSEPICDEQYLLTAVRYVHNNPAKAGLCPAARYPWSSYSEYASSPALCSTDTVLEIIGGAAEFARFQSNNTESNGCIDIDESNRAAVLDDDQASVIARELLGHDTFSKLKELNRDERDAALIALGHAGFSTRQVERLTGISKSVVARAWSNAQSE